MKNIKGLYIFYKKVYQILFELKGNLSLSKIKSCIYYIKATEVEKSNYIKSINYCSEAIAENNTEPLFYLKRAELNFNNYNDHYACADWEKACALGSIEAKDLSEEFCSTIPKGTKPVVSQIKIVERPNIIKNIYPNPRLSLIDGEYRFFQNYYIDDKQYTFGFPKENCSDTRVWIGLNGNEVERVSNNIAMQRIKTQSFNIAIGSNQTHIESNPSYDEFEDDLPF